jgi:NAD(P)-dependent dehydrogenase (short-subunit alcohol dehydrogenase family)
VSGGEPEGARSTGSGLAGRVALVTGASRGIGRATATRLVEQGATVVLSSRKQEALQEAAATMDGDVDVVAAHAGRPEEIRACVATVVERHGRLDILVNNAATNPYMGPSIDIDLARWDKTFEVNLRGLHVWTQEAWRQSMATTGGSVVNISSIGGMVVEPSIGIYNVTKAAVIHLTRTLAKELAPGVRVNAVAPGLVKTDMARALWEGNEAVLGEHVPLGRLGEVDDIAAAVLFLVSDAASWITGEVLVVDGGMRL